MQRLAASTPRGLHRDPDREVRRLLRRPSSSANLAPAAISGLEQEYGVVVGGRQVDFGELIDRVAPPGAIRRFAFDEQARVVRSGAVWTVDTPHAEVATPPRPLRPGVAGRLADDALYERDALARRVRALVPADDIGPAELRGYSTHVNAFADGVDGWALASHIAATYAPALMLLADRAGSPGLLVRPRTRRLEIGTEYLQRRDDLVAVAVVALAATIAAWHACRADRVDKIPAPRAIDPLDSRLFQTTWQRPGLFVPRAAFGDDLYTLVRAARLRRADGGFEVAQERLRATWTQLRPIARSFALPDELRLVDGLVAGDRPLPLERREGQDPPARRLSRPPRVVADPEARLLEGRSRGPVRLHPELVTWDQTILRVTHPRRSFFVAVPRPTGGQFLEAWAAGLLDAPLDRYAGLAGGEREVRLDVAVPGLFDAIEPPELAFERMERAKPGAPPGSRPKPPLFAPLLPLTPRSSDVPSPPSVPPVVVVPPIPPLPPGQPGQPGPGGQPPTVWQPPPQGPPPQGPPPQGPPPQGVPGGSIRNPRGPIWAGVVVLVTVVLVLTGIPLLTGLLGGSPSQIPGGSSPSPAACLANVPCASLGGASASPGSPVPSTCVPGVPCGSPTAPPTPAPTPRPTPRPTVVPTPVPDTTGPRITGLAWTPNVIGVPLPQLQSCSPNSGLGQSVRISVRVADPSGVRSVALRYQRQRDAAPVSAPMTLVGSAYTVTLSTANGPSGWYPAANQQSYVVQLSIRAMDRRGNARVSGATPGFTVTFCQ